jgi:hypothetical protein
MEALWKDGDNLLLQAVEIVERVAAGKLDRDSIRTEGVTDAILAEFDIFKHGPRGDRSDISTKTQDRLGQDE